MSEEDLSASSERMANDTDPVGPDVAAKFNAGAVETPNDLGKPDIDLTTAPNSGRRWQRLDGGSSSDDGGYSSDDGGHPGDGEPQSGYQRFDYDPDADWIDHFVDSNGVALHPEPPPIDPPPPTWRQRRLNLLAEDKDYSRALDLVSKCLGACILIAITVFVIWQLRPDLIFGPNMDVGGDNGGHVAAPYYLIHYLLPHGQISGWDPWWFDGFPLYVFYFPLPALFVAFLNIFLPYAVAFKVVTVLGTVTLPTCAWAFGRLAGFRRPTPVLMGAAMLPYLFNTSYTIDGGNITSTMAGEFSFSLSLSFGMLFLGVFCYGLRTGRLRWLAAVLFACTVLCHVVPALAFAGMAVLFALGTGRLRSIYKVLLPVGLVGGLLVAFWLTPFGADLGYTSSMNYQPVAGLRANFDPNGWIWVLIPAAIGFFIAISQAFSGRRNTIPLVLGIAAIGSAVAFRYLPSGLVYNGRWLPFWFLLTALLAAFCIAEIFRGLAQLVVNPVPEWIGAMVGTVLCVAGAAWAGGLVGAFPDIGPSSNATQVQGWINWNYTGFQGKTGWPQYQGMITMLDRAGAEYGCGRLQYEYISETTDPFGSTEAMMALPMQTNGCMETTDGIYFESSSTTPFHFMNVSEVSQNGEAPDPISGLNYPGYDLADGIKHLQLMGDRWFLAMSPPVEADANLDPQLVKVASTPGFYPSGGTINGLPDPHPVWNLYMIKNSTMVVPMTYYPVVEPMKHSKWLNTNLGWYEVDDPWGAFLAQDGPASWPHAKAGTLVPAGQAKPAPQTTVTHIDMSTESVSFDVSTLGTPVLVKIPYFPNWHAQGATGPYEVSPNLMAVVPTSHHVTLTYGSSPANKIGDLGTIVGVGGLVGLAFWRQTDVGPDRTEPLALGYTGITGVTDDTSDETSDETTPDDTTPDETSEEDAPGEAPAGDGPPGEAPAGDGP